MTTTRRVGARQGGRRLDAVGEHGTQGARFRSSLCVQRKHRRIEEFTGNKAGTGGLMTFKDSSWLVSSVVPHPPHFAGQADGVFTL